MKKSKAIVFTLMFALVGILPSFANNPISNPNEIRQEIYKLVSSIDVSQMNADTERVNVEFMVNTKNEIIVLNVSESTFDYNIKSRLNYHKVKTDDVVRNKIYSVPVVFKKS
jgi:hypothetical protein